MPNNKITTINLGGQLLQIANEGSGVKKYETLVDMVNALSEDGDIAYVNATSLFYTYNSLNELHETTGRWRVDYNLTAEIKAVYDAAVAKVGTIEENAQVNIIEGIQFNGVDLIITGKKVNIEATSPTKLSDLTNDTGFITKEVSDLDNYYTSTEIDGITDNKVDKEVGKSLSTNDLTNELKATYDQAVLDDHTHANKDTLDKFAEDLNGNPTYNGNPVGGNTGGILYFTTISAMGAFDSSALTNGTLCYVEATQRYYKYDSAYVIDPVAGKWLIYDAQTISENVSYSKEGFDGITNVKENLDSLNDEVSGNSAKLATIEEYSNNYTLPTASTTVLGGVKVDNVTVLIDADGVISSPPIVPTAQPAVLVPGIMWIV